eukprot:6709258-Pyramimonas_sp.AAC.1
MVEQQVVFARRHVLAAKCEYLRATLNKSVSKEDDDGAASVVEIPVKGTTHAAMQALVSYLHTGRNPVEVKKEAAL